MNLNEFQAHIEDKLPALDSFYDKAINYQLEKDKRRPPKKRWSEAKIERAANAMYKDLMKGIYEKIKSLVEEREKKPNDVWIDYLEKYELYEQINESLYEIEFD
ncbi:MULTISPECIES: hypothetical protein [Staphylococcus]|uniref:Uncharacterized protein n=2 Tax=Staphylococcus equorum TaxID=246432 RepID=A0A1E5TF23_9STAP|nr:MULTISPECIES: hypothetical protein [Staphylococcus]ALM56406.1 hypothetical protein SE1039_06230 [Staphylococcus equorum]ANK37939.1 hypothetical protein AOB58_1137 [Staphylococcus sp. AntiMn-1]ANR67591.1 hypothetical protein AWC34_03180 [Staphylococcus equorum]EJX16823.1 hypothetical protein SOJ_22720 [Staphylococcus sp. OJ82]ERH34172.1 hypothetical protein SEQU_11935 [Staphylococcus equorum UMC-CNS-924]